jgi:hypothetical protein
LANHQRLSAKGALRLRVGHHPYPNHCLAAEPPRQPVDQHGELPSVLLGPTLIEKPPLAADQGGTRHNRNRHPIDRATDPSPGQLHPYQRMEVLGRSTRLKQTRAEREHLLR